MSQRETHKAVNFRCQQSFFLSVGVNFSNVGYFYFGIKLFQVQQDEILLKMFTETLNLASAKPFNVIYSNVEYEYQHIFT